MKLTIISVSEFGGAGYSSKNLFEGFVNIKMDVSYLTVKGINEQKLSFFGKICKWWLVRKNIRRNFSYVKDAPSGYDYFTFAKTGYKNIHNHPLVKSADIINLHWISNMIDYRSFFENFNKPVIFTLHDTNPFTGGCHYNFSCENYLKDCSNCIQLSDRVKQFAAKDNIELKRRSLAVLDKHKTIVVSPSKWLKAASEQSSLFKNYRHFLVPYGIDTDIFKGYDISESRKKMDIPLDKFVIFFVATSLAEYRKGFDLILKLTKLLKTRDNVLFVAAGKSSSTEEGIMSLGFVENKKELAVAYSAADVFLIPSREDNLPNTMLEALCCGTPVIGFKTGGIIDAIEHGVNGFLAEKENTEEILKYLLQMLSNRNIFNRAKNEKSAKEKFALVNQALAYKALIEQNLM